MEGSMRTEHGIIPAMRYRANLDILPDIHQAMQLSRIDGRESSVVERQLPKNDNHSIFDNLQERQIAEANPNESRAALTLCLLKSAV
jgi:hypothetical protein